ncbi:hypothetical protein MWU60_00975 [Yoonia sp. F2084L]|uniref:hypothetical protein n=1 Tax=Yoonia sp. F2084L TaxID=2926419 RepID=UPI001FF57485|nr:hypothetical protein [Yoonia sp. F2084L]MCK0094127.1 hypothetical protein [Yoonia sp. F2084L]
MTTFTFKTVLSAAVVMQLNLSGFAHAGTTEGQLPPPPPVFVPPPVGVDAPVFAPTGTVTSVAVSAEATDAIRFDIQSAQDFCRRAPSAEYGIDCLGDALEQIARDMPQTGDYAEARGAIEQAARKLRALARENASPDLPTGVIRSTGPDGTQSNSPLTPVRTDTLAQTNAAAIAIIEEAETILLRSAANSAARRVHYEQIAQAVGSNKVLLRSL